MFETCVVFLVLITKFTWCTWMHQHSLIYTVMCVFWALKYPEVPVCVCPKYHPELGYGCSLLVFILGSPGHPNTLLVEGFNNLQCQKLGLIQNKTLHCLQLPCTVEMLLQVIIVVSCWHILLIFLAPMKWLELKSMFLHYESYKTY